ncbi:MAG: MgtC/SapB family protein [Prosthecobacter sp.]
MPATLPPTMDLLQSLATALGLGLLVGLQREWVKSRVAGIRTFALLAVFGALSGMLGIVFNGWVVAAAFIALASLIILGNIAGAKLKDADFGLTTEMAMLVMFAVGILCVAEQRLVAVVVAGTVMVLLHAKVPLYNLVGKIGRNDLHEIARLVLAGLVILPLLPNKDMGYQGVLNPFSIWLMVVLIVGISLAAYLTGKFLGGAKGTAVAGILGGLISSTATTASAARRSKDAGAQGLSLAAICLIASAIVFVRVIFEVVLTASAHWQALLPPLLTMMVWCGLVAAVVYQLAVRRDKPGSSPAPPSELKSAILFGVLYAGVLVVVAAAREHLGDSGLYLAAAISGLTDMDAITLSTSRLVHNQQLETHTAWRMILLGGMANMVFKAVLACVLGTREFLKPLLLGMAAALAGGAAILLAWPW